MEKSPENYHELYLNTYKCKTKEEIKTAYREWAPTYNEHMRKLCWHAPSQIAHLLEEAFKHHVRAAVQVLDVGAGTGLVGLALSNVGFRSIDGFDISCEMLEQAHERQVYKKILIGNAEKLSEHITKTYDAVVCVGALNFGHIAPHALREFLKVVKPNGYICFSTREDYFQKISKSVQKDLANQHRWRLLKEKVRGTSVSDMIHRHWLYQVL